jgi:adenylate kinase family enzyme
MAQKFMRFPIFKTKIKGLKRKFNLSDPKEEKEYFLAKAGKEIQKLKKFLKRNTFVAYLLGKKNSGKGTYSKMLSDLINEELIEHFSVGDMIRAIDNEIKNGRKKEELLNYLAKNYRGRFELKEAILALENRNTKTLLPTELILALIKREMEKREKKTLFIDGFPRDLDQINFSLFFRDLIGHREDPDIFVLINVPEMVIEERIKWRRICPKCQLSRNLKLLPTPKVGYDKEKKEFYLICEKCNLPMVKKEGDELGIGPLRERLNLDQKLMELADSLYGIPKIYLRNSIPVDLAKEYVDDYEITPEYIFEIKNGKIERKEKPWIVLDDEGKESFSLLPQPVVVSFIKQLCEVLKI